MPKRHYEWKVGAPPPIIGAHSLAKHRILKRYVERYIEIVTATSSQEQLNITFVDGYSGGGKYQFGKEIIPGSPLLLRQTVADMEATLNVQRTKGFRINAKFIFIDQNAKHTEFLRSEIANSPFKEELDKTILIWTADFNNCISNAIKIVKMNSPRAGRAVFLLDQFGWSQVAFRSIRQILNDLNNAEVFLTFSVDALIDYLSESSFNMRAFGEIDIDPSFVRELIQVRQSEQVGYRALIQNSLYQHVQSATNAPYYSPFFIKSPDAHRSYWFIHLSKHREARNEIGMIHWSENNTTVHHGGPALGALGFTPGKGVDQFEMEYLFDDHAQALTKSALETQLPALVFDAAKNGSAISLEELFGLRCNDTPDVRPILQSALVSLRDEG